MTTLVDVVLVLIGLALLVPSVVLAVECIAALLPPLRDDARISEGGGHLRVVIMIPAYDEHHAIRSTLEGVKSELGPRDSILVIADNCTDNTADIARREGAEVIERHDPEHRGKGYALDCGIAHLSADPPDVVVVLDADCRMKPGSIRRLASCAVGTGRPAQAEDILTVPRGASTLASVSALAFLVRNHVRPSGLQRLGLPCQLMGTGMAFPWQVILSAPPGGAQLVEDMQMGVQLAEQGFAPTYCPAACITSATPKHIQATRGQRQRWEHGHMATMLHHVPKLLLRGLATRNWNLLTMGLDLVVPPLALLVVMLAGAVAIDVVWALLSGSLAPLATAASALALVATAVFLSWVKYGREILPARYLLSVPLYVLWKIPVYLSFFFRGPHARWERAERSASGF